MRSSLGTMFALLFLVGCVGLETQPELGSIPSAAPKPPDTFCPPPNPISLDRDTPRETAPDAAVVRKVEAQGSDELVPTDTSSLKDNKSLAFEPSEAKSVEPTKTESTEAERTQPPVVQQVRSTARPSISTEAKPEPRSIDLVTKVAPDVILTGVPPLPDSNHSPLETAESLDPETLPALAEPKNLANPPPLQGRGQTVAQVGEEIITLPELTKAVKERLAQIGGSEAPSRKQIIGITKTVLKSLIVHSLILQEASEKLGDRRQVEATRRSFEQHWDTQELPALLRREGVSSEAGLRAKLARELNSPESLKDEYVFKGLAKELMRIDGKSQSFDVYITGLRKRRPISSIMSPSELAAAGRKEALKQGTN